MSLLSHVVSPRAATPENPRFSLNDPGAWEAFLAGTPASSGVNVTRSSALTFPAYWRGISLVSNTIAKLRLRLKAVAASGHKTDDPGHPSYRLVFRQPYPERPEMTAFEWKRTKMGHVLTKGNGYSYIDRFTSGIRDGQPRGLVLLDPDRMEVKREAGQLWYIYSVDNIKKKRIPAEDILHWKGLGWDGLVGYDVLTFGREALGGSIALQRYAGKFFANDAKPGIVIESPTIMKDQAKEQMLKGWNKYHRGLDNAFRTAILDGGAKLHELSINPENAQLIEQRKFSAVDIANLLGIPPHKLGNDSRTAFASLEQENQSYLDDGIEPWLTGIEAECDEKMLTEEEKESGSHASEFDRSGIVRADLTARTNYWRTSTGGAAWNTRDEARAEFGYVPLGGDANELLTPLNQGQGGFQNDPKDPGKAPGNAIVGGLLTQVGNAAGNAATDAGGRYERGEAFLAWLKEKHPEAYAKWMAGPDTGKAANGPELREAIRASLEDAARRVVKRITVQAKKRLGDKAWLDGGFASENMSVAREMLAPSLRAAQALGNEQPCPISGGWAARLLLGLELGFKANAGQEAGYLDQIEATAPRMFAIEVMGEG